jgi:tetratricopeptide (TPR) repeat protein
MGDENTNTNSLTISSGDDIAEELKALEELKKKIPSEHGGIFTIAPAPQSPVTQINAPDIEEERRLLEEAKKGSPEIGSAPPVTLADTLKHVGYGNISDELANLAREEQNPDVIHEFPQWFEKSPDQIGYLYQRRKNEAMGDVANKAIGSAITSTPSMIGNFVKGGIQVLGDATGIQLDELKHENDLTDDEKLARAVKSFYNPMQDVLEGGWRNLQRAKDHGTFVTDQYKVANGQMTEKEAEQQFRDREAINTHNAQFDATKPDSVARAIDYTRPLTQKAVRAMIAMQTASVDAIMAEHPEWTRDQAVNFKIDHDNLQSEQLIQNAIKEQNKTLPSDEQTSFGSLVNPLGNEFGWVNMGTHLAMNGAEATGKLLRFGGDLDKTGTMGEKGYQFAEGVASDAEKDVATPGRVQQAAESLANTIQKTGESVDVALNKLPEPIRTAVKAKLPSILTGAGLVGAGAVGAIEDPNNAVAGALKGLTLGSAVFAPRVLSDLLKADAKVAGGTGSMFKTAYDSPESALATKLFSYVPSRTIPVVNKVASQFIADKAKNFIRDGVHATTIATALGLVSDKDAEQIGADVANGMLFIGGHGAIGGILGKDPRQQIRDKRRQDYQNYQFLSGLDPADKEIVNDVSGWNNVVNHSQQKYDDAIKNYAEAYNNDPNSEDTKNLSKQVVRGKADLADKKGANFATREAYKREILSILAEEERKVNGSLLPGGNVKFRFMTRDQIADQLQRGNNNMDRATALHYADNAGARYAANGQGVQPLVFDPMRDSVVLNMDKMRQVQADTGKTMAWVLRHEIAEQLMHTKQGQELFQPLSDSLFGKQILKPDGSYMMDGKGVYTPEMLNEQFINNYLGKKTPQEKVVWAKNNGLWDYQNDDFDKPKVAQYMQKEVLAEANAAGLMDTEARLDSPLENLRAWAVVNGENSRLARITQGIVGRGSRNPFKSDLTGVTYTPEHFSQVRNANIQLQKLNGAIDATEQAPAPKVTPKDMMNNRSLAEGLGKDDGVFKTTKVLEILDDKGNVVATQLVDPKTYEGEWAHDPADNKNVKVAGYGSTPDFINNQIIPQGGKARISSQIVYDKEGKPAINTPAEFKAHQKIRTDAIRNIFDTIDSGINGAMTRGRTGEYNYRGSITDNQFKALMSLPEDIMSYSEKKKLALVRDVINDPSGSTMIGLHSARLNARGRYQAFTPKIREERPFSIQFSKDGHFLPVTFNVTGARDKVKYIMKYQPSLLTLWGNDPNKFMEGLSQYMSNWQNDPVIKDASGKDIPIDPLSEQAARIRHENLDEDPQVALQKRYIYDAFMNTQPPKDAVGRANFNPVTIELPKVKRKDKTKEEKDDFQRSDPNTLIRSPRLDGYHDIARGNGIKFPFQYGKSIYNAMPDAQVPFEEPTEPTSEPQQPAAPQPSSDILKGIQAVHSPVNAGFGAAFVPSGEKQTQKYPTLEAGFYSQLQKTIDKKMPNKSSVAQLMAIVDPAKGSGVKPDEIKWSNLEGFLEGKQSVTKEEVLNYLKNEGAIKFEERTLGDQEAIQAEERRQSLDMHSVRMAVGLPHEAMALGMSQLDAANLPARLTDGRIKVSDLHPDLQQAAQQYIDAHLAYTKEANKPTPIAPKYGQYVLPGGENYREVVLTMPSGLAKEAYSKRFKEISDKYGGIQGQDLLDQRTPEEAQELKDLAKKADQESSSGYTSSHFKDIPDYVAHMRLDERKDATGKDGLFIEEIQSDRHQAGREKGYIDPSKAEEMKRLGAIERDLSDQAIAMKRKLLEEAIDVRESPEYQSLQEKIRDNSEAIRTLNEEGGATGIADAPFRKDWSVQMFKRALNDAVASGKEWIGWTSGETQAERYDLSKQVDALMYVKKDDGTYRVDFIPKGRNGEWSNLGNNLKESDLADNIGKEIAEKIVNGEGEPNTFNGTTILRGVDLKVGGEGMKGFYDQILPKEIGKYVKKWGGKVEEGDMKTNPKEYDTIPFWKIKITPEMRKTILEKGQPQAITNQQNQTQFA